MPHSITRLASFLFVAGLVSCSAPAGKGARELILGSWELQSRTVTGTSGEPIADPVLGPQPIGRLFYDASGHVALQMMRQGRSAAISTPENPDEARNARVVLGYDAYFGTFTVDEAAGTVTHHVESSLFPEDLGKDFTRNFRVNGDGFELRFSSPTAEGGGITRTLVFRRSR